MGLAFQGLMGALAGAGNSAAGAMQMNMAAQLQQERDAANAVREQNLAKLRGSIELSNAQTVHGMQPSTSYDPATGRQLTYDEAAQADPASVTGQKTAEQNATISPYTVNGLPATYSQVGAAGAANNTTTGLIQKYTAAGDAMDHAANNDPNMVGPQVFPNTPGARSGNLTPEEQAQLDTAQSKGGLIKYTPEAMLEMKLENQKALSENKLESWKQVADIRAQAVMQSADTRLQAAIAVANIHATSKNSDEYRQAQIEVKKAEEERKNANAAGLLISGGADFTKPEVVSLYNKYMTGAGMPEVTKPPPDAPKPKDDGPGPVKKFISGFVGQGDYSGQSTTAPTAPDLTGTNPSGKKSPNPTLDSQAQDAISAIMSNNSLTGPQKSAKVAQVATRLNAIKAGK